MRFPAGTIADVTLAAAANEIVRITARCYGRGPVEAKGFQNDDTLIVVMKGGATAVERTLLETGESDLVRAMRLRFQEAVAETYTSAVEAIVQRRVLTYHSQVVTRSLRSSSSCSLPAGAPQLWGERGRTPGAARLMREGMSSDAQHLASGCGWVEWARSQASFAPSTSWPTRRRAPLTEAVHVDKLPGWRATRPSVGQGRRLG